MLHYPDDQAKRNIKIQVQNAQYVVKFCLLSVCQKLNPFLLHLFRY